MRKSIVVPIVPVRQSVGINGLYQCPYWTKWRNTWMSPVYLLDKAMESIVGTSFTVRQIKEIHGCPQCLYGTNWGNSQLSAVFLLCKTRESICPNCPKWEKPMLSLVFLLANQGKPKWSPMSPYDKAIEFMVATIERSPLYSCFGNEIGTFFHSKWDL